LDISDGVGVNIEDNIGMGVQVIDSDIKKDEEEFEVEARAGGIMEIAADPFVTGGIFEITKFETAQGQLKAGQLMASGERVGLDDRIRRLGRENQKVKALLCIERDWVNSLRHHMDMTSTHFEMTPEAIEELIAQ
nr:hypothetical protein [Tanacetum cinerariifolium]